MIEILKKQKILKILLLSTFSLFLSARLYQLVYKFSVNLLFWDQWDFLTPLFKNENLWKVFSQLHSPHRQGIGLVIDKFVLEIFDWNTIIEAYFLVTVIIISSFLFLYLKYLIYRKITFSDIAIPLIILNADSYESFLQNPNPSHGIFPILLIALYCITLLTKNIYKKYSILLIVNILSIYTGYALFLGFFTPVLLFWDKVRFRKNKKLMLFLSVSFILSILSCFAFLVGYEFGSTSPCFYFPIPEPFQYWKYMSLQYISVFNWMGTSLPIILTGSVLLAIHVYICFYLIFRIKEGSFLGKAVSDTKKVMFLLIAYSLIFSAGSAIVRICFSVEFGQASRYYLYMTPGLLGLYFFLSNLPRGLHTLTWVLVVLLIISNISYKYRDDFQLFGYFHQGKLNWKNCYLEKEDIKYCNDETFFQIHPDAEKTNLKEKLNYLKENKLNLFIPETE